MADSKITALSQAVPIATDIIPYVSDPGGSPVTKKALINNSTLDVMTQQGANITAASTTNLATATGICVTIAGNTTITAFGTANAGVLRVLTFTGTPLLTYNATSLILPGAVNYQVVAGDTIIFRSKGSGNWVCIGYALASGLGMVSVTVPAAASQADQETGTSTTTYVSPGRQKYHPSAAKAWVNFNGTGVLAIRVSYNVTSITDNGTGDCTVNFTTAFSSADYVAITTGVVNTGSGGFVPSPIGATPTASEFRFLTANYVLTVTDFAYVFAAFYGDQ